MPKIMLRISSKIMFFFVLMIFSAVLSMDNTRLPGSCGSKIFLKISAWEKPPVETGLVGYEWTAYATIIHLEKSGAFEMVGCIVRRSRSDMGISAGDKQTIWIGSVEKRDGKFYARYRQVMDISGVIPSSPEIESEIVLGRDCVILDGDIYDITSKIDLKDFKNYIQEYKVEASRS